MYSTYTQTPYAAFPAKMTSDSVCSCSWPFDPAFSLGYWPATVGVQLSLAAFWGELCPSCELGDVLCLPLPSLDVDGRLIPPTGTSALVKHTSRRNPHPLSQLSLFQRAERILQRFYELGSFYLGTYRMWGWARQNCCFDRSEGSRESHFMDKYQAFY